MIALIVLKAQMVASD